MAKRGASLLIGIEAQNEDERIDSENDVGDEGERADKVLTTDIGRFAKEFDNGIKVNGDAVDD